jgi:hypothetical protein
MAHLSNPPQQGNEENDDAESGDNGVGDQPPGEKDDA